MNLIVPTAAIFVASLSPSLVIAATDAEVERLLSDAIKEMSAEPPLKNAGSTVVRVYAVPGRRVTCINFWDGAALHWTAESEWETHSDQ